MVDTFELPSACVCHYKESFGFQTFSRKDPRFPQPFTMPSILFKQPDCSNGGQVSQPVKKQLHGMVEKSVVLEDPVNNQSDFRFPSPKSRPRRHPHSDSKFQSLSTKEYAPEECKGVRFGEVCNNYTNSTTQEYPSSIIRSIMRRNSGYTSPKQFQKVMGPTCGYEELTRVGFRFGFSFDESPVCRGETRYIFPKVARNVNGVNRFIVNTEEYKQGVSVVECHPDAVGTLICFTKIMILWKFYNFR